MGGGRGGKEAAAEDDEEAKVLLGGGGAGSTDDPEGRAVLRKLHWHLLPVFVAMASLCYLDRTNLAFASVQLTRDLKFNAEVYGYGSGIFFAGYAAFMLPSQFILMRVGAPAWLSILVAAWGTTACAFAFMTSQAQFYALRFLLGVAEAGAFPGMWVVLNAFYPPDSITIPYSVIEAAVGLANVLAAPLAASLLLLDGILGRRGWQWLFLLEGVPTVALSCLMVASLPRDYQAAAWLSSGDKRWLGGALATVKQHARDAEGAGPWRLLCQASSNGRVWALAFTHFLKNSAMTGMLFWVPTLVDAIVYGAEIDVAAGSTAGGSVPPPQAGGGHGGAAHRTGSRAVLLSAVPFVCAALCAVWLGQRSQARGEKALHITVPYALCAALFVLFPIAASASSWLGFACLTAVVTSLNGANAVLNGLVTVVARGPAQPLALALYNAVGNLGGIVGPSLIGWVVHRTGVYTAAMQVLGLLIGGAAAMVWGMRHWPQL